MAIIRRAAAATATIALVGASVLGIGIASATALPTGPAFVTGSGTYTEVAGAATITSTAATSVVTVDSLDIAEGESLDLVLPDADSTLVIRNLGDEALIAGTINGNGRIVIVSLSGAAFDPTADVHIDGHLLVTTHTDGGADYSDDVSFEITDEEVAIGVEEGGSVHATGSVAMIALGVFNFGDITSGLGTLFLGAIQDFVWPVADGEDPVQEIAQGSLGSGGDGIVVANGNQTADAGMVLLFGALIILDGETVAGPTTDGEGVVGAIGIGISSDLNFAALVDPSDSESYGARAMVGTPIIIAFGIAQVVTSPGPVPEFSMAGFLNFSIEAGLEGFAFISECTVDETDGPTGSVAIGGLAFDGIDVASDYDLSIPNQAPIVLPGFGTIALNQQETTIVDGDEILTVTGAHLVAGDIDVRFAVSQCGVAAAEIEPAAELPATGATDAGAGLGAVGSVLLLAGFVALLFVRRSRVA